MADQVVVEPSQSATASTVVGANADTSLLAANSARAGASVFNDSTANLYLLLSNATASATVYTCKVAAGGYYEAPFKYSGPIRGFWDAVNGNARLTEFL